MKRCLLLLLLLLPRVAPAQVDPAPAAQFVRQYAGHYRVSPELVPAHAGCCEGIFRGHTPCGFRSC
jgi:hypothetical protein